MKTAISTFLLLTAAAGAVASIPQLINYQGQLTASDGAPLDTTISITFTIYDTPSGGAALWTEMHPSITVNGGQFAVLLGSITPVTDVFTADRWLGVTIGADTEMIPRFQIVSVASAYRVGTVAGATGGSISGNVTIGGKATIGNGHTNTGLRAFVAGSNNKATGDYSVISGGGGAAADSNWAGGMHVAIGGGLRNYAAGDRSVIGGGSNNITDGTSNTIVGGESNHGRGTFNFIGAGQGNVADSGFSVVAGGWENAATHFGTTVGGGVHNYARGAFGTVAGGGGTSADSNVAAADYSTVSGGAGNIAGGFSSTVAGGARNIASGSRATISGGRSNRARGDFSVVAGGGGASLADSNAANGANATVSGGRANYVSGFYGTVAGGNSNEAGPYGFVAGGSGNRAVGNGSFAAGFSARANHFGSFVWGTSTLDSTVSFNDWTFTVRCANGAHIYTSLTGTDTGVSLPASGGAWASLCDVHHKRLHGDVNTSEVLSKVASLSLHRWSYKAQDASIQHIGPTAQDFYATFGLGDNNTTISTLDPDGVALAAIQELAKRNSELEKQVVQLQEQMKSLVANQEASAR